MEEGPNVGRTAIDPPYAQEWVYDMMTHFCEICSRLPQTDGASDGGPSARQLPHLRAIGKAFLTVFVEVILPFVTQFQISYLLFSNSISLAPFLARVFCIIPTSLFSGASRWLTFSRISGAAGMAHAIYVLLKRLLVRHPALHLYRRALMAALRSAFCRIANTEDGKKRPHSAGVPKARRTLAAVPRP